MKNQGQTKQISVRELMDLLKKEADCSNQEFEILTGESGFDNIIQSIGINRPGLTLTGTYDFFVDERIQVFGKGESYFLNRLDGQQLIATCDKYFQFKIPCCFFTHFSEIPGQFLEYALRFHVPLIKTTYSTVDFTNLLSRILDEAFAESVFIHGGLLEVHGTGILIVGKSGVGKSETALELVERGHLLIADDTVKLNCFRSSQIHGTSADPLKYYMEIRGLGIINIKDLFGIGAVRKDKVVEVVVQLEEWDSDKEYDRLGLDDLYFDILGIRIPLIVIPVRPGRNIPVLIEIAAMNTRLKKMGFNSAKQYDNELKKIIHSKEPISK